MPEISKITLPSGNTYDLKDAAARDAIASLSGGSYFLGVTTTTITDQSTTNPITINGSSVTAVNGNMVIYGSKEFVWSCTSYNYYSKQTTSDTPPKYYYTIISNPTTAQKESAVFVTATVPTTSAGAVVTPLGNGADVIKHEASGKWVEFGDTSNLGDLATKNSVTICKSKDSVLGEATTFTASSSSVSFGSHTTKNALGTGATFSTVVTPTTTNIKATASGTAISTTPSDEFVKELEMTQKNISFSVANEILSIGGNGFPTSSNTFTAVTTLDYMTGSAVGSVSVSAQPTIALSTGATAGTGVISVATGITSASTSVSSSDTAAAITALGAGTAAAQTISVGTNDIVDVATFNSIDVEVE